MSGRLVILCSLVGALISPESSASSLATELKLCRELVADQPRLSCYDALFLPSVSNVFKGQGSGLTPEFMVTAPRLMRFHSSDAVMIVYLLDETGAVVQNLHRGGAGEGTHLIQDPGRYSIQVNATGHWEIQISAPNLD